MARRPKYSRLYQQQGNAMERKDYENKELLRASEIARRWGVHPQTIARSVQRGELQPALKCGRSALFSLADVERIENGRCAAGGFADLELWPTHGLERRSPAHAGARFEVARQALGLALDSIGSDAVLEEVPDIVRAVEAAITQVQGGDGAHNLQRPSIEPGTIFRVNQLDAGAGVKLAHMAYAAIVHRLMNIETRRMLNDPGEGARAEMLAVLNSMREALASAAVH
jgi:hypothetical protein